MTSDRIHLVRNLLSTLNGARSEKEVLPMTKETMLILDKDFHTQWTLRTILESERYIVLAVDSVERALTNFQEFEVSGLITEDQINHNNVTEIIRELKKDFPE